MIQAHWQRQWRIISEQHQMAVCPLIVPITAQYISQDVQVEVMIWLLVWHDILWVWPDSYQEHNALLHYLHVHNNPKDSWQSLLGTFTQKVRCNSMFLSWAIKSQHGWYTVQTLKHDYKAITLFRQRKGHGRAALVKQYLTVKDDLKHYCVFMIPISVII